MSRIWELNWFDYQVKITKSVNGILYFFRRIPLIGKKISPKIYQFRRLKVFLTIICAILGLIKNLALGFSTLIPAAIITTLFDNVIWELPLTKSVPIFVAIWLITVYLFQLFSYLFPYVNKNKLELADNFSIDKNDFIFVLRWKKLWCNLLTDAMIPLLFLSFGSRNFWVFLCGCSWYHVCQWFSRILHSF